MPGALQLSSDDSESHNCFNLTYRQRLIGFAVCFGVGITFQILAMFFIWFDIVSFAAFYSLGNLSSIISLFFLMNIKTQFKRMFHKRRWIPATIVVLSILLVIILAITSPEGSGGIIILLIIVQWFASCWYVITYIPFGEKMVGNFIGGFIGGSSSS